MITQNEYERLLHDLKRSADAMRFLKDEKDIEKQQVFISLIADSLESLHMDLIELKEK